MAADRWSAAWEGYSSLLKEHLEALSVTISIGICGCWRADEQPAAEDGGGGGDGLVARVDGAACGAALGARGVCRSGARAAMARGAAADAPPEPARAVRTARAELRSRGPVARALLCVVCMYFSCAWRGLRRSGGSTCCVGRTTTARLLCIRPLMSARAYKFQSRAVDSHSHL